MRKEAVAIKSLERAVHLLELLTSEEQADWSISELRVRTGNSLSTLHRFLSAWQVVGFVEQHPVTRRYRPGLRLMELGMAVWRRLDLRLVARPVMERLARRVGCTVYLTVRDGLDGITIERVDSSASLRLVQPIGFRVPLYAGGSKKVLIAHLPEAELAELFARFRWVPITPRTVTDPETLQAHLAAIREKGYEVSYGETEVGSAGASAPVWGADGRVVAGLMAAGPERDFGPERLELIIRETLQAAGELSVLMGHG